MRKLLNSEIKNIAGGFKTMVYQTCYDTFEPIVTTDYFVTPVFDIHGFYAYDAVDVIERVDYIPVTICN